MTWDPIAERRDQDAAALAQVRHRGGEGMLSAERRRKDQEWVDRIRAKYEPPDRPQKAARAAHIVKLAQPTGRRRSPSDKKGRTHNSKRRKRRRRRIFERDGYRCAGCGGVFPAKKLTLDHIVPAAKGGSNRIENLQTMCRPCNQTKADAMPEDVAA